MAAVLSTRRVASDVSGGAPASRPPPPANRTGSATKCLADNALASDVQPCAQKATRCFGSIWVVRPITCKVPRNTADYVMLLCDVGLEGSNALASVGAQPLGDRESAAIRLETTLVDAAVRNTHGEDGPTRQ
eukprot:332456-Prorocentrum_minimum.AAC.1